MTTTSTETVQDRIEITAGPSIGQIWDAAKFAYSEHKFTVTFRGVRTRGRLKQTTVRFTVQIVGVRHEDGSGDSFILYGNIISHQDDPAFRGTKMLYYKARRTSVFLDLNEQS